MIVLLLFFQTFSFSQSRVIDSLKNELKVHHKHDTLRIQLLNTIAFKYYGMHDLVNAETAAIEANTLSKQLSYPKGEAKSAYMFCKIHMNRSENDEAIEDCLEALELYQKVGNAYALTSVYNILGNVAMQKSDPDKSLDYFSKAYNVAKEMGHLKRQSEMLINIGNISYMKGNLDEAIDYYKKSMALNEEIGNQDVIQTISNNIAAIYMKQGRSTEALEFLNNNLKMSKAEGNQRKVAMATLNIGALHYELEQYEKGLKHMKAALAIYRALDDKINISHCLVGIGGAYAALNNHQKALEFFSESLTISEAIEDKYGIATCLHQLGGLNMRMNNLHKAVSNLKRCLELSESLNDKLKICNSHISLAEAYILLNDYSKALHHAITGEKLANDLKLLQEQKIVNDLLFQIYEVNENYKKALDHHKQFKILSDTLFNKEKIEKIAQIEYEYKYKQALDSASIKELKLTKTIKTTSQDLEKTQRNLFLGVIGFLITALILGGIIFFLKLRHEKTKTQTIALEQKLLRSQMTPHFIFNSLSVLQGMILNKEDKKSVYYLSKFSKLLRLTLENSRDKLVPLNQELEAINNYLELQNLEASQSYDYTILVDKNIDDTLFEIPPMLIQPFIENAIEHAFEKQKTNRKIDIQLKYVNSELICTITDNGIGIDAPNGHKRNDKKSLATTITNERLQMLSKDFNIKGSVQIEDRKHHSAQGTIVTLVIPYKTVVANAIIDN